MVLTVRTETMIDSGHYDLRFTCHTISRIPFNATKFNYDKLRQKSANNVTGGKKYFKNYGLPHLGL